VPQLLTDAVDPVNILYYGEGGTGKTSHLASLANLGRVLFINAEGGVKRRPLEKLGINVGNVELFPGPGELLTVDAVEKELLRVREALDKDPGSYVGVCIDSITELVQAWVRQQVDRAVVKANRAGKERDPYFTEQADYGVMTEQIRKVMRIARDLRCHLGVSALDRRVQDPDGTVGYKPAVTPALQNDLDLWMDVICVTEVFPGYGPDGKAEFRGLFAPGGKWKAKDRLNALPRGLVEPTMERIVAYVDGELEPGTDSIMTAAKKRAEARAKDGGDPAASTDEIAEPDLEPQAA
jgi:hypothetical protein